MLSDEELRQLEVWTNTTWRGCPPVLGIDYLKLAEGLFATIVTIRVLQARVAELERRLNPPCPDPSIDAFYLEANADFDVTYIDGKPYAKVVLE